MSPPVCNRFRGFPESLNDRASGGDFGHRPRPPQPPGAPLPDAATRSTFFFNRMEFRIRKQGLKERNRRFRVQRFGGSGFGSWFSGSVQGFTVQGSRFSGAEPRTRTER